MVLLEIAALVYLVVTLAPHAPKIGRALAAGSTFLIRYSVIALGLLFLLAMSFAPFGSSLADAVRGRSDVEHVLGAVIVFTLTLRGIVVARHWWQHRRDSLLRIVPTRR